MEDSTFRCDVLLVTAVSCFYVSKWKWVFIKVVLLSMKVLLNSLSPYVSLPFPASALRADAGEGRET